MYLNKHKYLLNFKLRAVTCNDTLQKHDHIILYNKQAIKNPKEVKNVGNQCQKERNKIEMNIQIKNLYIGTQIVNVKKLLGVTT